MRSGVLHAHGVAHFAVGQPHLQQAAHQGRLQVHSDGDGEMTKRTRPKTKPPDRSALEMTATQARSFFLKPESYCRLKLPEYFDFGRILRDVKKCLAGKVLASPDKKARRCEDVNHTIYSNKDGRYAWRPFELIHPVIYVDLANRITEPTNWARIQSRFSEFAQDPEIRCLSIPRESVTRRKDQGAQIRHWWQGIEQASIELALDFNYVFHADISNCYGSVYTHSIAWATYGKQTAKTTRNDKSLIGNVIDNRIQDMRHGQTNGIPQGSVLLDLIAELVLGYADLKLSERLRAAHITGFQILRYRDDYRVFVNSSQNGELILKALTEVLIEIGLKLNISKTTAAQAVIESSIKIDKREWMRSRQGDRNLQKQLLLIHSHGTRFPNAGSLHSALDAFYRRIASIKSLQNPMQMISIATDIGYNSPRCFPIVAAVLSKILSTLRTKDGKLDAIRRIRKRLDQLPNNGHLEVWLQRISYQFDPQVAYAEKLCTLVQAGEVELWDSSWIDDMTLRAAVDPSKIVNRSRLKAMRPVVPPLEFAVFGAY
jgi:hypothetical protein